MTVSSTATFVFNISQIITMAYRDAGLISIYQTLTTAQQTDGVDKLTRISMASQAKGLFARTVTFQTITLATNDTTYDLSSDTLDAIGPGMYADPSQPDPANSETLVTQVTRERWHENGNKSSSSRPTLYYVDRNTDTVKVVVWPVPSASENLGRIRFQTHRFRADVRDPNATVDYERYWTDYLVAELAAKLALSNSLSLERYQVLKGEAASKLLECKAYSKERPNQQFSIGHRSGWRNR